MVVRLELLERIGRDRLIFGHRGVPDETPENTLASFRRAVELSLDGVELDVFQCKSGELVIFHDEKVDKLTDGSGQVVELTFEYLRGLDAGSRFSEDFKGERIPTLEETLEILGGRMIVNIELKSRSIPDDGLEAKVVALVQKMGLQSSVVMSSFNPFAVLRTRKTDPNLKTALLFADDQPIHLRKAWASYLMTIDGLHPRYPMVESRLMKRARAKNWYVGTWTVDDVSRAKSLFEMGVAILITNQPALMQRELGAAW